MMGMGGWTNGWCLWEDADQVFAASADKPDLGFAALHPPPVLAGHLPKQPIFKSCLDLLHGARAQDLGAGLEQASSCYGTHPCSGVACKGCQQHRRSFPSFWWSETLKATFRNRK